MVARISDTTPAEIQRDLKNMHLTMEPLTIDGVHAYRIRPTAVPHAHANQLVLNVHGGGYVLGAGLSGVTEAMLMASCGGYEVIAIDYRMPPDAPYPAALNDVMTVWKAEIKTHSPARMAVMGTSAGGALVIEMVQRSISEGLPVPGAIGPSTPWSDLTETGDSYRTNEWADNILVSYHGYISHAAKLYAGSLALNDPNVSPIYGSFKGFPPTILSVGTRDLFLSNTARTQRAIETAGGEAKVELYEGFSHAQYLFDPMAPESQEVFKQIGRFFDAHLQH